MNNNTGMAADQLRKHIERVERLEEEKKDISDDIREVYAEAKSQGFDTKVMKIVVKLRKLDPTERQEALGMVVDEGQAELDRIGGLTTSEAEAMGSEND
jgi:uncharacterized protein (UPF0335 family)